ncbi:MAG: VOC family protein [Bacteroidetes bacterium]|nr:VOC family protein [Bacteroidota bacterium]
MISKIATVGIYVADQEIAARFWTDVIGFVVTNRIGMENGHAWIEVGPAMDASALVLYPKSLAPDFQNYKPSIVFACSDIDRFYTQLQSKGVVFPKPLSETPWGKFASFIDEDGNEFGLKAQG